MNSTATPATEFPASSRALNTRLSSTAAVVIAADKLRAQGVTVIDLGVGEPDFPTPDHIKDAAKQALDENFTKYTSTTGILPLRQAICDYTNTNFGSDYTPEQCCVTVGGKQAIFSAVMALINPGAADDLVAAVTVAPRSPGGLAATTWAAIVAASDVAGMATPRDASAARSRRTARLTRCLE